MVISATWQRFLADNDCSECICESFCTIAIYPLMKPMNNRADNIGKGYIASMQIGHGKKADEVAEFIVEQSSHIRYDVQTNVEPNVMIQAKQSIKYSQQSCVSQRSVLQFFTAKT